MNPAHFKLLGVALMVAGIVLAWSVPGDHFTVDACLDAGGSYDRKRGVCDMGQTHPAIPASFPWPLLAGSALAGIGFGCLLKGWRTP
jgi:hypothetical protein